MLRAFDHICMEKGRYKFLIIIIIIIIIINYLPKKSFYCSWSAGGDGKDNVNFLASFTCWNKASVSFSFLFECFGINIYWELPICLNVVRADDKFSK